MFVKLPRMVRNSVFIKVIDYDTKEVVLNNVNQNQASNILGVSQTYISAVLRGKVGKTKPYYQNEKTGKKYIFKLQKTKKKKQRFVKTTLETGELIFERLSVESTSRNLGIPKARIDRFLDGKQEKGYLTWLKEKYKFTEIK